MTSTQDQAAVMIPGMAEAISDWMGDYHELYIERAAPRNDSETYARRMEESGLMGRAFNILFQINNSIRRNQLDLNPPDEEFRPFTPRPAGAHPFDVPPPALPQRPPAEHNRNGFDT